jgi:hypothetical protein
MVAEDGGRAMVWPEDVPVEVARAAEAEARKLGLIKPGDSPPDPPLPQIEIGRSSKERPPPLQEAKRPRIGVEPTEKPEPRRVTKPKPLVQGAAKRPQAERTKRELPPYLRVIK